MRGLLKRCGALLPTAIVGADDMIAQGALRALHERGIAVPHDVSLAGIDDIPSARLMIPALTTLRQPIREMIREAFQLLTGNSGSRKRTDGVACVVAPELVIRESCSRPQSRREHRE